MSHFMKVFYLRILYLAMLTVSVKSGYVRSFVWFSKAGFNVETEQDSMYSSRSVMEARLRDGT